MSFGLDEDEGTLWQTGNNIMANKDTAILNKGLYKYSDSPSSRGPFIATKNLDASVKCDEDIPTSCVLDGERKQIMNVLGTGGIGTKLSFRALTFKDGRGFDCGGFLILGGAVEVTLCRFINCEATIEYNSAAGWGGGGAIFMINGEIERGVKAGATQQLVLCLTSLSLASLLTVIPYMLGDWTDLIDLKIYATEFEGNKAKDGGGNDIFRGGGTVSIYSNGPTYETGCPSPYEKNTPINGERPRSSFNHTRETYPPSLPFLRSSLLFPISQGPS